MSIEDGTLVLILIGFFIGLVITLVLLVGVFMATVFAPYLIDFEGRQDAGCHETVFQCGAAQSNVNHFSELVLVALCLRRSSPLRGRYSAGWTHHSAVYLFRAEDI